MSSEQAKLYHSINIGAINTWDDWHLVPTSRPLVNPPNVKTHYVAVPGRDGELDLTEALAGKPVFQDRSGDWEFFVINSGQLEPNSSYGEWYSRYTTIMQYVHGQYFEIILDDDPYYCYKGRLTVKEWNSEKGNSLITLSYILNPYKWNINDAAEDWLWDPFNFETGVIKTYKNLPINGWTPIDYILNADLSPHPIITCTMNNVELVYDDNTYILRQGRNELSTITFHEGINRLLFNGRGYVTIQAIGGLL